MQFRRCNCGCGGDYPEHCFRTNTVGRCIYLKSKSIMCEQTARDNKKVANRWIVKARDTKRRHAKSLGFTVEQMDKNFGWDIRRIAHELEFAYGNGCSGPCARSYDEMGHGLLDITIDIVNPELPPVWGSNTRIMCGTCNRQKSKTPHDVYVVRQYGWQLWKENQEKRKANPYHGWPLFEGLLRGNLR